MLQDGGNVLLRMVGYFLQLRVQVFDQDGSCTMIR